MISVTKLVWCILDAHKQKGTMEWGSNCAVGTNASKENGSAGWIGKRDHNSGGEDTGHMGTTSNAPASLTAGKTHGTILSL